MPPRDIPVPAQLRVFVDAIGVDRTVKLLLTFGGAPLYIGPKASAKSRVAREMGMDVARALSAVYDKLPSRIPTQKPWLAKVQFSKGLPVLEIARKLHVTDKTVRLYLKDETREPPQPELPLFD